MTRSAIAADDPQEVSSAQETLKTSDLSDSDEADSDSNEDEVKPQVQQPVGVDRLDGPMLGFVGLVVDVIGAILGEEVTNHLDEAQVKAITQEYEEQLWPQLKSELEFVRLFCGDLTVEQRKVIKDAARKAVSQVADKIVRKMIQDEEGNQLTDENVNPGAKIREAIIDSMKNIVSERQLASFTDEANKRVSDRQRVVVLNVVCQLDEALFLSENQRASIQKKIASQWKQDWEKWQNNIDNHCFPEIPDQCLVPLLNPDQIVAWNGLQKVNFAWETEIDMLEPLHPDEEDWWGLEKDRQELAKIRMDGAPIYVEDLSDEQVDEVR